MKFCAGDLKFLSVVGDIKMEFIKQTFKHPIFLQYPLFHQMLTASFSIETAVLRKIVDLLF